LVGAARRLVPEPVPLAARAGGAEQGHPGAPPGVVGALDDEAVAGGVGVARDHAGQADLRLVVEAAGQPRATPAADRPRRPQVRARTRSISRPGFGDRLSLGHPAGAAPARLTAPLALAPRQGASAALAEQGDGGRDDGGGHHRTGSRSPESSGGASSAHRCSCSTHSWLSPTSPASTAAARNMARGSGTPARAAPASAPAISALLLREVRGSVSISGAPAGAAAPRRPPRQSPPRSRPSTLARHSCCRPPATRTPDRTRWGTRRRAGGLVRWWCC